MSHNFPSTVLLPMRATWVVGVLAILTGFPGRSVPPSSEELRPWDKYRVILWVGDSASRHPDRFPLFLRRLRELGADTAMVHGHGDPTLLWKAGFPYYVENMVNRGLCLKWNSKVRDWDAFVTTWARSGRPTSAFRRDYCLDDPAWLEWACHEVRTLVGRHRMHAPLAYDLRDELSVTISANPFDYDFNPPALAGFRRWLRGLFGSIEALNRQWDTAYARWDEVMPFSTDQIKRRMATGEAHPESPPDWRAVQQIRFHPQSARQHPERWNLAPWCDFRSYMDLSLARVLEALRRTAHQLDPHTPVGIEGTQMPHAFGGYDLWRLSRVLDWVEPYDIANAREIWGSFMPGKPILCTVFEKETAPARRRLWHLLLEGDRGCIIWWSEDCLDWSDPALPLTAKGRALAPVLHELHGPLAQLFLEAQREWDPIVLVYSQPSIQVDWLIESTRDGSTWHRRFSSFEAEHNLMARRRNAWLKAWQDLGASPRFVPIEALGAADPLPEASILVLPTVRAMSAVELRGLERWMQGDGRAERRPQRLVLSDGTPADFDEHGRLRVVSPLAERWGGLYESGEAAVAIRAGRAPGRWIHRSDIGGYARERLSPGGGSGWIDWLRQAVEGVWAPPVQVAPERRVRVYRYRLGEARLLAFERGVDYHMSEDLKQAGGNEALEQPVEVLARLREPGYVVDLRAERALGWRREIRFRLDPWQPSLWAVLPRPRPAAGLAESLLKEAP